MLPPSKVDDVRRLLTEKNLSQRQIAKELGISRGSVSAIASGRRPDYPIQASRDDRNPCLLPPVRCGTCGGLVYRPCRLCQTRAVQAGELAMVKLRSLNQL